MVFGGLEDESGTRDGREEVVGDAHGRHELFEGRDGDLRVDDLLDAFGLYVRADAGDGRRGLRVEY